VEPKLRCPLCQNVDVGNYATGPTRHEHPGRDMWRYDCPRCGRFLISGELLQATSEGFPQDVGLQLSGAARSASDAKQVLELITENVTSVAEGAATPRSPADYFDRVFEFLALSCRWPGGETDVSLYPTAARCFLPRRNLALLIFQLTQEGLIEADTMAPGQHQQKVRITFRGWERVDQRRRSRLVSRSAFVAMWFDPRMDRAYAAIESVLASAGYKPPFRVDDGRYDSLPEREQHTKIDDRIIDGIRRARFVVADFSGNRQAVYYEAGYAVGLGVPVIWCCRRQDLNILSFDTRQIEHISWDTEDDLARQLEAKIGAKGWRW
jgi:nucleoside 2-deoxyribosyltransferase